MWKQATRSTLGIKTVKLVERINTVRISAGVASEKGSLGVPFQLQNLNLFRPMRAGH